MDYKQVLEKLITAFETENVRYALKGGFALGLADLLRQLVKECET